MPTSHLIAETDEGRLVLHGNEVELYDLTGRDPVALRLRSANEGIGKLSFDRPDGRGGWTEIGYIFGKRDERGRSTPQFANAIEYEFWRSGSRDSDAERLFAVRVDGAVFYKGGSSASVDRMTSSDGRFVTVQQTDGNFVTYDTRIAPVGEPRAAVWASGIVRNTMLQIRRMFR